VLHVAFERSLPVGEMEEMLRSAGARVVEGPERPEYSASRRSLAQRSEARSRAK